MFVIFDCDRQNKRFIIFCNNFAHEKINNH